ncbi:MAG TPA: helix-turn-helix domain-containing protein [Bryobacteraceae bacterium]
MARYRELRPPEPLRSFVDSFWTLEQEGGDALPQRVVPDGHAELILNLGEPFEFSDAGEWRRQPRCFFTGQIAGPLLLRPSSRGRIIGIRFHPHGAARVFGPPMQELARGFTPVGNLSAALAHEFDRALDSNDPIAAVEAALLHAGSDDRRRDLIVAEAVRRAVAAKGRVDIAAMARSFALSTRQFERRFTAAVGLPPKLFCRMQRFVHVFRVVDEPESRWVDAAVACGYYDQAHLIRDFKEFSGETPSALIAPGADLARHFLERFGVSHSYKTAATGSE